MTRLSRTTLLASLLTIGAVFGTGVEARAADVVIGVVGVMSGPYAIWGENLREGATLAAETINEKGGAGGHRVSLLFRDDEANPTKSVTAVTELIERQKVDGLVASATTGATLAILPYIAKARIPHFLASSSGTNIDPRLNPFTFKTVQSDSLLAKEMARYLVKDRKFKKIGIFHVADGFGNNLKTFYTSALSELGIPPASVQSINNGETDATSQVLRLRQDGVEAIMVGALEPELATLLRSMEKVGFSVPAVSSDISVTGSFFNLMANKIPDFLFAVRGRGLTYSAQQPLGPQVKDFVARVNRRFGVKNRHLANVAAAYDAVQLIALSVSKNGSLAAEPFKATMESLKQFPGVVGAYGFAPDQHMAVVDFTITKVSDVNPEEARIGLSSRIVP